MAKIAIVDGYSGGECMAPQFIKEGHELIHIQSDTNLWNVLESKFDYSHFEKNYTYANMDLDLKDENIDFFIPGTETGVELADELACFYGAPHNDIALSSARRDKYLMMLACKEFGLQMPKFKKVSSVKEALNFFDELKIKIVLKPLRSAGTDGVFFCESISEIESAFIQIQGKENKLGGHNTEVLISEFMNGDEYFIDTISSDGNVNITDIWRYEKRKINGHSAVYDRNILCDPRAEKEKEIIEYAEGVLKALKINYGPAHIEIMMTDKGPMLVEIGARLDGLTLPEVNRKAIGYSPVDILSKAYLGEVKPEVYEQGMFAQTVYLTSYQTGILLEFMGKKKLESLDSFFQLSMRVKDGGDIKQTINYFTAPGFLTLISESEEQINKDYESIRKLEKNNELFKIK